MYLIIITFLLRALNTCNALLLLLLYQILYHIVETLHFFVIFKFFLYLHFLFPPRCIFDFAWLG